MKGNPRYAEAFAHLDDNLAAVLLDLAPAKLHEPRTNRALRAESLTKQLF